MEYTPSPIGDAEPGDLNILPLRERYRLHVARFENEEKPQWDSILALYSGEMWQRSGPLKLPDAFLESEMVKTSVNIIFAIVETGKGVLVPDDPQVTVREYKDDFSPNALAKESKLNHALREGDLEGEMDMATEDAILYGRMVLKVGWDHETRLPYSRECDLNSVFFDLEARRVADIRYWMECTPLSKTEFFKRIENGTYPEWARAVCPQAYPQWLRKQMEDPSRTVLEENSWYIVYEYYDVEHAKTYHFCDGSDRALLYEDMVYVPYILDFFNSNKKDCRGLSEIGLVANNQMEVNVLSSMLLEIVRTTIPRLLADPAIVDEAALTESQNAPIGSISMVGTMGGKTLEQGLHNMPQPQAPTMLIPLVERLWQSIMFVSALADAQRGQVTGAKTATELAFIDAQLKNRLHKRQRKVLRVVKKVAELYLYLMSLYDDTDTTVIAKDGRPVQVGWDMLQGKAKIQVVPFSPQATTREVLKERWMSLYPAMANDPLFDAVEVRREFLSIMELPDRLLAKTPPAALPGPGQAPGENPLAMTTGPGPRLAPMPNMNAAVVPPTPADGGPVVPSPSSVNPNPPLEQ